MRWIVLLVVFCGCHGEGLADGGDPLRRDGECARWPVFSQFPTAGVLDDGRVFVPLGKTVVRSLSAQVVPCSDPSNARLEISGGGTGRIVSLGTAEDGAVVAASIEFETSVPGPLDVKVDFGEAVVQARWYAVEERHRLVADPSAVFVTEGATVRSGAEMLGQVPPRAFSVGSIVWSHGDQLESWVVSDGGISSRGVFQLDGTWSVSAATESTIVAVRPGGALEISFADGGYQAMPIIVDPSAQDPLARVNGRWVRYRQGVLENPNDLSAGFAGGRLCELDGGCTAGNALLTELRADGIVAIPRTLDRFVLLDGPGAPRASIEFPLGRVFPWLKPMTGVEGAGTALVTSGGILVPEFTGTPRLLFYPAQDLFLPTLTRDWFIAQDVAFRR